MADERLEMRENNSPTGVFENWALLSIRITRSAESGVVFDLPVGRSTHFLLGSTKWRLLHHSPQAGEALRIAVLLESKLSSVIWELGMEAEITVSRPAHWTLKETLCFSNSQRSQILSIPSAPFDAEVPVEHGTVVQRFEVNVKLTVTRQVGLRELSPALCCNFDVKKEDSDLICRVGEAIFFVNTAYLSVLSPYFKDIRSRLGDLPIQEQFELPLIALEGCYMSFHYLMKMAYPAKMVLSDRNVLMILESANNFSFDSVIMDCENYLMSSKCKLSLAKRLNLSIRYSMAHLQHKCFSELTSTDSVIALRQSDAYKNFPPDMVRLLLCKMVQLVEMEQMERGLGV